jgi:hypothetical protein
MLLINYATRGRPELLSETLKNIYDTIGTDDFKIFMKVDVDDKPTFDVLEKFHNKYYPNFIVYAVEHRSKVYAINEGVQYQPDWDVLLNMSDDFKFVQKNWYGKMIAQIQRVWGNSTDFFAHFNDNYTEDRLPTMHIVGRDYYLRDNFIYHPSYGSVSCDAEAYYVALMRGKYHYFPEVFFHHLHPANNHSIKTDATYLGNDKWDKQDTENYFERMKHYFYISNPVMIPEQLEREIKNLK